MLIDFFVNLNIFFLNYDYVLIIQTDNFFLKIGNQFKRNPLNNLIILINSYLSHLKLAFRGYTCKSH